MFSVTDVLCSKRDRSLPLRYDLVGVKTDLDDVIEKREERCQRKRCHEYGDEAILDHW